MKLCDLMKRDRETKKDRFIRVNSREPEPEMDTVDVSNRQVQNIITGWPFS